VVITPNSTGRIVGSSTLTSHCLKGAQLQVTVTGSTVVLAGSDKAGNTMTLRGSLDSTGTLLKSTYVLNGSATGACETDDGTGTLAKQ
jgi:nitrous oxidase accessory protein NosD